VTAILLTTGEAAVLIALAMLLGGSLILVALALVRMLPDQEPPQPVEVSVGTDQLPPGPRALD